MQQSHRSLFSLTRAAMAFACAGLVMSGASAQGFKFSNQDDSAAKEEADGIVYPWMLTHTRAEAWEAARNAHAMLAPLYDGLDVWHDENFHARGMWTEVSHPEIGTMPMLGRPYVFESSPWRIRHAAPSLGQHTDSVFSEAGLTQAEIASLKASGVAA